MLKELLQWDRDTFIYLNTLGVEKYDTFWLVITNFSTWIPLFLLILFLIFWKNNREQRLWVFLTFVSMLLVVVSVIFITKFGVGRLRPNNDPAINSLIRVVESPKGYSFFSGHAASSFSIATLAVLFFRMKHRWIYIILLWPILFSISRIYLGVHYPIDIIVGTLVGVFFASFFYKMHKRFKAPYIT